MKKDAEFEQVMNKNESNTDLGPEKAAITALLASFSRNDVNALVLLENEDGGCLMSNGISRNAILEFLCDLFLKHPEMLKFTMGILRAIIDTAAQEATMPQTVH